MKMSEKNKIALDKLYDTWDEDHVVKFEVPLNGMGAKIFKLLNLYFIGTTEKFIDDIVNDGLRKAYREWQDSRREDGLNLPEIEPYE